MFEFCLHLLKIRAQSPLLRSNGILWKLSLFWRGYRVYSTQSALSPSPFTSLLGGMNPFSFDFSLPNNFKQKTWSRYQVPTYLLFRWIKSVQLTQLLRQLTRSLLQLIFFCWQSTESPFIIIRYLPIYYIYRYPYHWPLKALRPLYKKKVSMTN